MRPRSPAGATAAPAASMSLGHAAGQAGDDRAATSVAIWLDGVEIAVADDRETGLDDIDVEAGELAGDLHFFAEVHGRAGALFAVAQGGVEDDDFVGHGIE